jgi:hypothetical protein
MSCYWQNTGVVSAFKFAPRKGGFKRQIACRFNPHGRRNMLTPIESFVRTLAVGSLLLFTVLLCPCGLLANAQQQSDIDTSASADPSVEGPEVSLAASTTYLVSLRNFYTGSPDSGPFMVAEGGGGGIVNNNRSVIGPWEKFIVNDLNGGSLMSGDLVVIQTLQTPCSSGGVTGPCHLTAEGGGGGDVNANRPWAREWERFKIIRVNGAGVINDRDTIALQAYNGWQSSGGNYVVADFDLPNGRVRANRSQVGPWEKFTFVLNDSTKDCQPGYYDMLDWMTLDADLRASKHLTGTHNMFTVLAGDRFWWMKTPNGDTWDIDRYDNDNIYWWITENTWNTPNDYKKFRNNVVASRRCQQSYTSIGNTDTTYDTYLSCSLRSTQNLRWAYFSLAGPMNVTLGGDMPANMPVLKLTYNWNCDSNWQCSDAEVYWFAKRYGWVRWQHFQNGTLVGDSQFNLIRDGVTNPLFGCPQP